MEKKAIVVLVGLAACGGVDVAADALRDAGKALVDASDALGEAGSPHADAAPGDGGEDGPSLARVLEADCDHEYTERTDYDGTESWTDDSFQETTWWYAEFPTDATVADVRGSYVCMADFSPVVDTCPAGAECTTTGVEQPQGDCESAGVSFGPGVIRIRCGTRQRYLLSATPGVGVVVENRSRWKQARLVLAD